MSDRAYTGCLFIGDPHLEGRAPGFRKDEYPTVILEKLRWCLEYAAEHRLLPAILGDLFDKPRDNPNWMMVRLLEILQGEVLGLYGNHDVHYNPQLTPDDSLSVLVQAGRLRLVSHDAPWAGEMNGRPIVIGGASYRQPLPERYAHAEADTASTPLVIWLTHHDVLIPGYDEGRLRPCEIPGVDLVINGHIHRRLDDVVSGRTTWLTPGNISRRTRSEASRAHVPSALRLDITGDDYRLDYVTVPHAPFEDVFHDAIIDDETERKASAFVSGLAEMQARRTASGEGLMEFLRKNAGAFPDKVAAEIFQLAEEVIDGPQN